MIKFIDAPYNVYCEEDQEVPFKMAFCKKEGTTVTALHEFFKCRDFVAEALFSEQIDSDLTIYGFGWGAHYKEKPILTSDKLYIAVKGNNNIIKENLHLLEDLELECDMRPTKLHKTDNKDVIVLESDIGWRKSVTLLNLFTLIIKTLSFDLSRDYDTVQGHVKALMLSKESLFSREIEYWKQITKIGESAWVLLIINRDYIFDIDWKKFASVNTSKFHHGHGPVAFFTAVGWVQSGVKDPCCCDVIKPSVLRFCEEFKK